MANEAWKRMSSGIYVDLNNLKKEDIRLEDIEVSLNNTVRFNGHAGDRKPLTVAQHSLLCMWIARSLYPDDPELYKYVLAHDFAEAYIGDVATPVKKALGKSFYDWADPIEELVDIVIVGYHPRGECYEKVKLCDRLSLDIERRAMWKDQRGTDKWPQVPIDFGLVRERVKMFDKVSKIKYVSFKKELEKLDAWIANRS